MGQAPWATAHGILFSNGATRKWWLLDTTRRTSSRRAPMESSACETSSPVSPPSCLERVRRSFSPAKRHVPSLLEISDTAVQQRRFL